MWDDAMEWMLQKLTGKFAKKKKKELDSPVIPEVAVLSCGYPLPVLAAHHCCCDSECEDDGYITT